MLNSLCKVDKTFKVRSELVCFLFHKSQTFTREISVSEKKEEEEDLYESMLRCESMCHL